MKSTLERIVHTLNTQFDATPHLITPQTILKNDLGLDSLDIAELIVVLETEFNILISDQEAERMITIGDLLDCIEQKINPNTP